MCLSSGERTEAVDVMQYLWTGKWPHNCAPRIASTDIERRGALANVLLEPAGVADATLTASDPEEDPLTYRWELLPEATHFGYGGIGERRSKPITNLLGDTDRPRIPFKVPTDPGSYRLFVTILDGHGNTAAVSIPFHVQP